MNSSANTDHLELATLAIVAPGPIGAILSRKADAARRI
jgi:hypothetical protein